MMPVLRSGTWIEVMVGVGSILVVVNGGEFVEDLFQTRDAAGKFEKRPTLHHGETKDLFTNIRSFHGVERETMGVAVRARGFGLFHVLDGTKLREQVLHGVGGLRLQLDRYRLRAPEIALQLLRCTVCHDPSFLNYDNP